MPKLTPVERQLLYNNDGCLKCRRIFVPHRSTDCPNDFPNALNYKLLTQSFIDLIKRCVKKPVAAIALSSNAEDPTVPVPTTVAAVMGMSNNPTGYMVPNRTSVIEGDSFSDDSVSHPDIIPTLSQAVHVSSVLTAHIDELAPLTVPHLYWHCCVSSREHEFPVTFDALLDHGADTIFISEQFTSSLALKHCKLFQTMSVEMVMPGGKEKKIVNMSEWVKLCLYDLSGGWKAKAVRAVVAPSLCTPVILGLPFLAHNKIVIDHEKQTAIAEDSDFDLLNPKLPPPPPASKKKLKEIFRDLQEDRKLMVAELKMVCAERACKIRNNIEKIKPLDHIAAIRGRLEELNAQDQLHQLGESVKNKYKDIFAPIPHLNDLPSDVYCRIKLKDATKMFTTRSYSTPRKYKEAWATLIQQHLDVGRIQPSNSAHASLAFIIPKADKSVLPRWVNNYRALNANTVTDSHPLPQVDDILADCAKGKIWSVIDMTNSFFQTRVHLDDVHLTAVTTPFSLYKWLTMPMGLCIAPAIHQRRMTAALREHLG